MDDRTKSSNLQQVYIWLNQFDLVKVNFSSNLIINLNCAHKVSHHCIYRSTCGPGFISCVFSLPLLVPNLDLNEHLVCHLSFLVLQSHAAFRHMPNMLCTSTVLNDCLKWIYNWNKEMMHGSESLTLCLSKLLLCLHYSKSKRTNLRRLWLKPRTTPLFQACYVEPQLAMLSFDVMWNSLKLQLVGT